MAHHNLKASRESFELLALRISEVQLRKNDRGFQVGDTVSFYEWDQKNEVFTGHTVKNVPIVTLLAEHEGLTKGWCLLVVRLPKSEISRWEPGQPQL